MTLPSYDNDNVKSRPTVLNNVDPAGAICINDVSTGARREVCWWLYTIDYTVNEEGGDVSAAVKIQLPHGRKRPNTHKLARSGECIIAAQPWEHPAAASSARAAVTQQIARTNKTA